MTRAASRLAEPEVSAAAAAEIRDGLAEEPRQLPSRWLYDALGSSLFDAICELPWYRITRAEQGLLAACTDEIGRDWRDARLVELGCGNGAKMATLARGFGGASIDVHLVDVSAQALERSALALGAIAGVRPIRHHATYEDGLGRLPAERAPGRQLMAFLGSNIGNFDPPGAAQFLRATRGACRPGDGLLLGADLVKPESELLLAYDDPLGLTAAFNKNLLLRLNTELAADFDLAAFAHRAVWNAAASRVEMHLVSGGRQDVSIPPLDLRFTVRQDEAIWTESSYKYEPDTVAAMVEPAGFRLRRRWIDHEARFMLALFDAA